MCDWIKCFTSPCAILSIVIPILLIIPMVTLVRKSWVKNDMKVKQAEMEGNLKLKEMAQAQRLETGQEMNERAKMHLFDGGEK